MGSARLQLDGLQLAIGRTQVLHDVSLRVDGGEVVGLIGPSGAGKTLTARAILGLVDLEPGVLACDLELAVDGAVHRPWDSCLGSHTAARDRAFAGVRGKIVGWLPQQARAALDPLRRVGWQVRHAGGGRDPIAALRRAGLADPERVAQLWPNELSGGMARRVTIAQALAGDSRFLLIDEPTNGLDAIAVRDLCTELRRLADSGLGLLVITHDLRALEGLADRLIFLDAGRVVERLDGTDLTQATSELAQRLVGATRRISGRRLA